MAFEQKPPPNFFDPKNPQPPLDLERMFNEERIDMKAILDSRKLTKEINKTLSPYTGEFGDAQKKHLLKRTMVGYASRHLKDLEGMTIDEAVDMIMTPHEMGEPVNTYYLDFSAEEYKEKYGEEDVGPGEPFISTAYKSQHGAERRKALYSWLYHSFYDQPTSISWKFFLFLHNLTPVEEQNHHKMAYGYLDLIFRGPFRDYRDFVYDLTLDPLMLQYLNLSLSQKETPDENYAREVQELFTVGKRPFSKFTEEDVREAARLLVGWNYDREVYEKEGWKPEPRFEPNNHDTGDKYFSEFYNNTIIKGQEGQEGKEELREFIDMLFQTDETAIYLSRRLFQFFVYPILTEETEKNIILPLAQVMRENNYSLSETLKVLLKSEYFYATELYNSMIKSPFDFTFSLLKEFDLVNGVVQRFGDNGTYFSNYSEDLPFFDQRMFNLDFKIYHFFGWVQWHLWRQGMLVLNPPSVSGWPAYYQEPVYDFFWINSVTATKRIYTANNAARWGIDSGVNGGGNLTYDIDRFIAGFEKPEDIDLFISELADRFLGGPIPQQGLERIKRSALGGSLNSNYWTAAVLDYMSNPNKDNRNLLRGRLIEFLYLLFNLNEIQLH